jgi:hypothetical protein
MITDDLGMRAAAAVNQDARIMPVVDIGRVARRRRVASVLAGTLLLIMVLGGGALVASALTGDPGSEVAGPVWEIATCPPGSNPNAPGPPDQARPEPSGWGFGAVDTASGLLVTLRWDSPEPGSAETWAFDLCTNTWRLMSPPIDPPSSISHMVYDAQSDLIVAIGDGDTSAGAWVYDTDIDVWTRAGDVPIGTYMSVAVYDPVADVILIINPDHTWAFDVDTGTWEQRSDPPDWGYQPSVHAAFDATLGRIVAWTISAAESESDVQVPRTSTYDTATDTWERLDLTTPWITMGYGVWGGHMAHDTASGLTVLLSPDGIATLDSQVPTWEYEPQPGDSPGDEIGPLDRWNHGVVADPINDRIVVFGGDRFVTYLDEPGRKAHDIWAFNPTTREWTLLLADDSGGENR